VKQADDASTIELSDDASQRCRDELKRYFAQELDQDIGDLKADLLLRFILEKLGPSIYNQAIEDAASYMQEKVLDMEAILRRDE